MQSSKKVKYLIIALGIGVILFAVNVWQTRQGEVLGTFTATSTPNHLKLIFFDVGQGDASLIIAPGGEDILVDGGPDNKVVQKLGEYLPYSDRKIEYVILTHPHADHVAGLAEVLKRYEVGQVIMTGAAHPAADYQEFLRLIEEKNIPILIIDRPQDLAIGGASLAFLEPTESLLGRSSDNPNNGSVVFQLRHVSTTALYMGDFENEEELASSTIPLKSDVLKVGHHGSTNANSRYFLEAVSPKYAIISAGAGNSYGHPHYRTLYYLKQLGAYIFRTDENGDIRLESDGIKYEPSR